MARSESLRSAETTRFVDLIVVRVRRRLRQQQQFQRSRFLQEAKDVRVTAEQAESLTSVAIPSRPPSIDIDPLAYRTPEMLFMAVTVVLGVLMYLFVQRVVVMKPVGIAGVDEAIDQLIERQKAKSDREEARKRRKAERSWASTTLSEHTMEIIESLEATTCPTERSEACSTATPLQQTQQSGGSSWAAASRTAATAVSAADPTTARSMGSAVGGKKGETPLEFDKTFDPKEAVARKEQEEGEKKAHRHHHKHHHRHRSRAEEKESKERSEDSSEEGDDEQKSKGGHQKRRHKRHRSKDAAPVPRLDTPIAVAGETLPVPDGVDVEMRGQEPLKTP